MNTHELAPKKSLGQHFLHDQNVIQRIADGITAGIEDPARDVLFEIGPGTGALTSELLERGFRVHAFEIDQRMIAHLEGTLQKQYPELVLHHADFLRLKSEEILGDSVSESADRINLHLVGNLPYYATSQILFKVLELRFRLTSATFMIQKEVAERIVASPRTKEYGILSVQTQLMSRPVILFDVKPGSFTPPPKVMSSVIQLTFNQPPLSCSDATLKTIVRTAFQQRRKKLSNALKTLISPTEFPAFDFTLRPEAWEPRMYERMAEAYEQNVKSSSNRM